MPTSNLLRLFRLVRRYWSQFSAAVALMALGGGMDGVTTLLLAAILDRALQPHSGGAPPVLLYHPPFLHHPLYVTSLLPGGLFEHHNPASIIVTALIAVVTIKAFSEYFASYLMGVVGFGVVTDLRNALYEKLINQSAAFFHKHSTGRLISTVINDIDRIQFACANSLADALQQFFTLLAMGAVVLLLNWRWTLGAALLTPLVIVPAIRLGRRVRRTTRKGQDELADVQHILHETFTGNRIVKAFNMELREIERFREAALRLLRYNLRYIRQQGLSSPMMEVLGAATIGLFVLYARGAINAGAMTVGTVGAFVVGLFRAYEPLRRMPGIYNSFQTAEGASQRVFEYMDVAEEVRERPAARKLRGFHDVLRFEGVAFRYTPDEPLLHEIAFTVRRGEVVALVGPSGAGKTTLVNLIPRFFDVTAGRVSIDGVDVRDFTLRSLREQVAYVTQDTILFNDTVLANIAYGSANASEAGVHAAARAALADEFIAAMPEGYQTLLGERGLRLSGGQRQRIAIARAILKNAPLLILDEATSALDTESEALVQKALANLMRNRTTVVIAHRLSTVRSANRILVLDGGRIAGNGTHAELLAAGGLYRRLHDLQFADREEAAAAKPL